MQEVNLPRGKLLDPTKSNVQQHKSNSLANLPPQAQAATTLKGTILQASKGGDIIFTTTHGKFLLSQLLITDELRKGDKLVLQVEFADKQLKGKLITVNGLSVKTPERALLNPLPPTQPSTKPTGDFCIDISKTILPAQILTAAIDYINLSKINTDSVIYQALTPVDGKTANNTIELKISASTTATLTSPYQLVGEIIHSEQNRQLIKTRFGILSANNLALPVGKKLVMEIYSINNISLNNTSIRADVADFLFRLNNNFAVLNSLTTLTINIANPTSDILPSNTSLAAHLNNPWLFSQFKAYFMTSVIPFEAKTAIYQLLTDFRQLITLLAMTDANSIDEIADKINTKQVSNAQLTHMLICAQEQNAAKTVSYPLTSWQEQSAQIISVPGADTSAGDFIAFLKLKEVVAELTTDFLKLKESFNSSVHEHSSNIWTDYNILLYDGARVIDQKISITRQPHNYVRFVVALALEVLGDMQLAGLIKLNQQTKSLESFDLVVRFKKQLKQELQAQIHALYYLNQHLSGIRGALNFEQVLEFA